MSIYSKNLLRIACSKLNEGIGTNNEIKRYLSYYNTKLGKKITKYETKLICSHLLANTTILSIGCGPAVVEKSLYHSQKYLHVITLDKNRDMLNLVPFYLNPIWANSSRLPFFQNTMDSIVCITSLEFMNNPKMVLKEIHRVLKRGGIFLGLLLNLQSEYVQQKLNENNSYIKKNLKQITYDQIISFINDMFEQNELYNDLYIENNKIKERASTIKSRLLITKAIK